MFSHYHVLPRWGKGGSHVRYMHAFHIETPLFSYFIWLLKRCCSPIIVDKRKAARWAGRVRAGRHERYNTK